MRIFVWLMNRITPSVSFDEKTLDGVGHHDTKRLVNILAYWLALAKPLEVATVAGRKQAWVALAKQWLNAHPLFGNEIEHAGFIRLADLTQFDVSYDGEDTRL